MKEETLVMTIEFGNSHFNAIYLNNQLKLIASNGNMTTMEIHEESTGKDVKRNPNVLNSSPEHTQLLKM